MRLIKAFSILDRFLKGIWCAVRIDHEWFITNGDVHAQKMEEINQNFEHLLRLPFSSFEITVFNGKVSRESMFISIRNKPFLN